MGCPQCQSEEISSSGTCLVCGFQVKVDPLAAESPADDKVRSGYSGVIEMIYSGSDRDSPQGEESSEKEEIPPWRQELSQRLQAIRQKRETLGPESNSQPEPVILAVPAVTIPEKPPAAPAPVEKPRVREKAEKPLVSKPAAKLAVAEPAAKPPSLEPVERPPEKPPLQETPDKPLVPEQAEKPSVSEQANKPRVPDATPEPARPVAAAPEKPRIPSSPRPRQRTLQPLEPPPSSVKPSQKTADPKEIRQLIDSAVSRQSGAARASIPQISIAASARMRRTEGKLILLSRTLSGLIDLIFVVICGGIFILATDYFSGIIFLDSISLVDYALLFLLTYFLYSIFFLTACGQTMGMMITGLRVVGKDQKRSSIRQLFGRCLGYLVSLLGLGIGLLWGLFDGESRCFHDRISNTRVIRIQDQLGL
jgi:uncharacterized RDD family membrane protein YckC